MGTAIVLVIVAIAVFLAVRVMIRDKKKGKSLCGMDCSKCKGGCHLKKKLPRDDITQILH